MRVFALRRKPAEKERTDFDSLLTGVGGSQPLDMPALERLEPVINHRAPRRVWQVEFGRDFFASTFQLSRLKTRHRLFLRRKSRYHAFDAATKTFTSLKTKGPVEATRLLVTMNEAGKQPVMNLSLIRVYLRHSDPMVQMTVAGNAYYCRLFDRYSGTIPDDPSTLLC